jgi:hypothetical protein
VGDYKNRRGPPLTAYVPGGAPPVFLVQPGHRLIHHDQVGADDHGARQRNAPAHTATQARNPLVGIAAQPQPFKVRARLLRARPHQPQIVRGAQLLNQPVLLKHRRLFQPFYAGDPAGVGGFQPQQKARKRGLPAAGAPRQRGDLAGAQRKADAPEHLLLAVCL